MLYLFNQNPTNMINLSKFFTFTSILFLIVISGCKKNGDSSQIFCEQEELPIVMAHGFLASGDTYANQFMRFTSNGYCSEYLFAFDWNSLTQDIDRAALLDNFINEVLAKTGKNKVNLVGHSAGGGLCYEYLSNSARAAKVAHYVHIGSNQQNGPAGANGEILTLNIWSPDDLVVNSGDIVGATNVTLNGADHYEVATRADAFEAMYRFFNNNTPPSTTSIQPDSEVKISGKVLKLGENDPVNGADIFIFELDAFGVPLSSSPQYSIKSRADGKWGPVSLTPSTPYLFEVNTNISGDRKVFYYREGFSRSNTLVYLRTIPTPNTLACFLLASIPENDNQSVLIVFSANKAVLNGRDELLINNVEISTEEFAAPEQTSIAFFLYDGNNNQQTDLEPMGLFGNFPFLAAADFFMAPQPNTYTECKLNDRKIFVKNRKSASEGISIAVFD
jgi:pimeloyl-ACP methyl ester carboxylesterase